MLGKVRIEFIGHKEWVDNMVNNLADLPAREMVNIMDVIKGRAQSRYLIGPYPEHLRVGKGGVGGHLRQNIQPKVEIRFPEIIGSLSVASTAYYGLIWEAVGRYEHRKGMMFSGNDTPMCRPFAMPAYRDLASWTLERLSQSVVMSAG